MTEPRPSERRILDRVPTEPIPVVLMISVDGTLRSLLRRRPTTVELAGRIVDVSIAGAGIESATKPGLPRGLDIGLRYGGTDSIVRVRSSETSHSVGMHRYGVEFVRISPALKALLHSHLPEGRPDQEHWLPST